MCPVNNKYVYQQNIEKRYIVYDKKCIPFNVIGFYVSFDD